MSSYLLKFMGIDLAGKEEKPTGWAIIDNNLSLWTEPGEVFSNLEIIEKVREIRPEWIGIDAPLSFPRGKDKMRLCDKKLRQFGSPALSPFFLSSLVKRGMEIARILKDEGYKYIEVYPRATQKILNIKTEGKKPGKSWCISCQREISKLLRGILPPEKKVYSSHALDAILCAYTAYCRWKGNYREIGGEEGKVVVPC